MKIDNVLFLKGGCWHPIRAPRNSADADRIAQEMDQTPVGGYPAGPGMPEFAGYSPREQLAMIYVEAAQ